MRHRMLLSLAGLGGVVLLSVPGTSYCQEPGAPPPPPPADVAPPAADSQYEGAVPDTGVFRDQLAPYGRWVQTPEYGEVWIAGQVDPTWRPYTVGHWVYTDYGWTWTSEEPWGWATYHYGRWVMLPNTGWCWVPGRVWTPAWVAWRSGGGYCGWAPLPPRRGINLNIGVEVNIGDADIAAIPEAAFSFCEERFIAEPRVREHVVAVQNNTTIIHKTTNITNIRVENNKVVNNSLSVQKVEQATGKKIERVKVAQVADADQVKAAHQRHEVTMFRPTKVAPHEPVKLQASDLSKQQGAYEQEHRNLQESHAAQLKQLEQRHVAERAKPQRAQGRSQGNLALVTHRITPVRMTIPALGQRLYLAAD